MTTTMHFRGGPREGETLEIPRALREGLTVGVQFCQPFGSTRMPNGTYRVDVVTVYVLRSLDEPLTVEFVELKEMLR